jgi:hypothetical protein
MSPIIQTFPDATLIPNGDGTFRLGVDIGKAISMNITGVSIAGNMNQGNAGTQAWPVTLPTGTSFGAVNQGTPGTSAWPVTEYAATMPLPTTLQSAVSGNATGTSMLVVGQAVAMLQVVSSPSMASGTSVNFYGSENGINYFPILAHQIGTQGNLSVSATVDGIYRISVAGLAYLQARIASYGYGTVTVIGYSSPVASHPTSITGLMGSYSANPPVTPTINVTGTFSTGDYVGTSGSSMEFTNCARLSGGTVYLPGATLIDFNLQSVAGELWLFDQAVTPPNSNAAWGLSAADMAHLITVIPFSTYYAGSASSNSEGHPDYVGPFKLVGTSIFGCFVTRGAPVYSTNSLTFKLSVAQD